MTPFRVKRSVRQGSQVTPIIYFMQSDARYDKGPNQLRNHVLDELKGTSAWSQIFVRLYNAVCEVKAEKANKILETLDQSSHSDAIASAAAEAHKFGKDESMKIWEKLQIDNVSEAQSRGIVRQYIEILGYIPDTELDPKMRKFVESWNTRSPDTQERATEALKSLSNRGVDVSSLTAMASTQAPVPKPRPDDEHVQDSDDENGWHFVQYHTAKEPEYLTAMRQLLSKDLSEPYSIYVYRYFLYSWPDLCFLCVTDDGKLIGVIINKLEPHIPPSRMHLPPDSGHTPSNRGYIAMLATHEDYRKRGIATRLVKISVKAMKEKGAEEVVLETEVKNKASLGMYERLGFLRTKKLHRYYLNGNEAYRLELNMREAKEPEKSEEEPGKGKGKSKEEDPADVLSNLLERLR